MSYNVYVDGELVTTVEGDGTTLSGDAMEAGDHTISVSAVYANGSESKPANATITVVTGIEQIMADGQPVDIYSVDGRLVRRQATSLSGLRGIYVAGGKTVVVK